MLRNEPPKTWIKPDQSFNSSSINSENFLIKGDNLEALKLLKNAYEKKIKMIYIDPPYNTGGDGFIYADDRKYSPEELSRLCGMSEQECKKMLEYYSKGKNSHSAWLTFMYPRLSLARNLLRDDGVIFISIDDHEQAQLKILCDEIFGEENFVACMPRITKKAGKSTDKVANNHDYVLCYSKGNITFKQIEVNEEDYRGKDKYFAERGGYKLNQTLDYDSLQYSEKMDFEVEIGGIKYYPGGYEKFLERKKGNFGRIDWVWRWSEDKVKFGLENGFIEIRNNRIYTKTYFKATISNKKPYSIEYIDRTKKVSSIQLLENKYSNDNANKNLQEILGQKNIFDYSKSVELIKFLISQISILESDIILDFFAGSGTTAQAVMELNAEDNGNRKFILVQLPEPISEKSKSAYDFVKNTLGKEEPKISDITQERIIRASKQIKEKYPDFRGDLGFQVFELEEIPRQLREIRDCNFEQIHHLFSNEDLSNVLDIEAILQTFCLYDGIPLNAKREEVDLGGYIAYRFDNRLYLLHQDFQTHHLQELLRKIDEESEFCVSEIVLLAYCFESARRREIAEALNYLNRKSLGLKLLVRG